MGFPVPGILLSTPFLSHFNLRANPELGFVIISVLQMGKLRFGEIKYLPN